MFWYYEMSKRHRHVSSLSYIHETYEISLILRDFFQAFHHNYDSVQRWTRWKEDHERVKTTLSSLPDKLSHEVVVPFGSKALIKAKLVHTNEVLTCIGSSWFVKQSAKQGIEMCERRIARKYF